MPAFRSACLAVGLLLPALGSLQAQTASPTAKLWLTTQDRSKLLAEQTVEAAGAGSGTDQGSVIEVDAAKTFQTVDGFGFALTGGSAQLIHAMTPAARRDLLQSLFGKRGDDLAVSYLRISVGSSDMNDHVFTYDDVAARQTDPKLQHFSLAEDQKDLIPVLKEILAISPGMKILASPWTAPSWMKTNGLPKGGNLKPELYPVYAAYLVKYVQAMQAQGVPIAALTMQNEPLNPKNTPSMVLEAPDEAAFLRDALGPAMAKAGLKTRVILFDHNCNHPDYPETILGDAKAAAYADGSGFHLYEGEIDAMSQVHEKFPAKNLYFTEQMVVEHTRDGVLEPVAVPVSHVLIGAMRNWSRNVLLWNLAADPQFGPHTNDGGCPVCQGAITIDGDKVERNIALWTVAHASRFVPPGSVRIDSTESDPELANVAWKTPEGRTVLLVTNTGTAKKTVTIRGAGKTLTSALDAGSVGTYVW